LEELRKIMENRQNRRGSGRDMNLRPAEYKAEVLPTPQQHSVILKRFRFVSDFSAVLSYCVHTGSQMAQ
jgi:hypothetical protein